MDNKDKTGDGICILSLGMALRKPWLVATDLEHSTDSGGPGAYSQLLIIKEYMTRRANDLGISEKHLYPADFFDLMGGVGFGG